MCDEILSGIHDSQFVTKSLQGGAGTSINMNVNEVIANRATEILDQKGFEVHPNDHVNLQQSTNDVNPSALRIVSLRLDAVLIAEIKSLIQSLEKLALEHKNSHKLGRTHIQDAVPMTFGEEFCSYKDIILRDMSHIEMALSYMNELSLGGTAIGNGINASLLFKKNIHNVLSKQTKLKLKPGKNAMALTSSGSDFCHLSATLHILSSDLSKIATDLRFLSSGPRGGIGEIHLPEMQSGSSIMPGKVNPVIPESINQIYYFITGKHTSICQASEASHLELAIMFPVIADALISELHVLITGISIFNKKCIMTLQVDKSRAQKLLEQSTAYATLFTKKLGYDAVASIVKESIQKNKTFRDVVLGKKFLSEREFDQIIQSRTS